MHIKNKKICEVLIAEIKVEQGTNAQRSPDRSGTIFCVGLQSKPIQKIVERIAGY